MNWFNVARKHPDSFQLRSQIFALLLHPNIALVTALLAVIVTLPTLWQGWIADDFMHREMLLGLSLPALIRGMFSFVHPDPQLNPMNLSMEAGSLPWWTIEDLKLAFFRPLAVLTHWLDYQLWPESGAMMHLQSIAWYAGACALATLLYRRVMGATLAAGLAGVIFAIDSVHIGSVAWLANRNILISLVFGLLCLLAHDRWRRDGWRAGLLLAPLCLLLSVLAAEAGMAVGGYLFAYMLFLDRAAWRQRLLSLAPYVIVGLVWVAIYRSLGYGTWGSGFYSDPMGETVAFAAAVLERGPVLLLSQWIGQLPAPYNLLSLTASRLLWLLAILLLAAIFVLLFPLVRRDRVLQFWMVGMLLAIVPACSIRILSGRLLIFASLGAMALIGAFLPAALVEAEAWFRGQRMRTMARRLGHALFGLHVVLPLLLIFITVQAMTRTQSVIDQAIAIGSVEASTREVVIVNAPSPFHFIYLPGQRALAGQPAPEHLRVLAPAHSAVQVTRHDEQTFLIRPAGGFLPRAGTGVGTENTAPPLAHVVYMYQHLEKFFRSDDLPMTLGQRISLPGTEFKITEMTPDGRPWEVRVLFAYAPEDDSTRWLQWDWTTSQYIPFAPPPVGQSVWVSGPW
jgi:hypothetical protein